jgi:ERCC4-type nuclease
MLKIDHRETKLKPYFAEANIEVIWENLVHGDIQIWLDDAPFLLFERKSTDDLLASIKDGRYKNQKANCIASGYTVQQMYYIIEGTIKYNTSPKNLKDKTLHGAIINTLIRDKIGIFFTKNLEETFQLIQMIYSRVKAEPEKYKEGCVPTTQIQTLSINEKTTPAICYLNQLCQIPDISKKTAEAIVEEYPTLKQLLTQLGGCSDEERTKALSNLKTTDAKGSARKISSKAVSSLNTYLFQ